VKSLAVIPARGGSKRIRGKNIKELCGKPLIAFTIEEALQTDMIDRVIVSTDDINIANIAREYGAEVPFIRPSYLAQDHVPDQPVLLNALQSLYDIDNYQPDIVLNLRPTSPFKTCSIIERVLSEFSNLDIDMVRTMTKSEGVYHPYWMYELSDDGMAKQFTQNIDMNDFHQSQLLPPIYRINGVVDAYRTQLIYDGDILSGYIKGLVISEMESIDIDTDFDFELCKVMMQRKKEY
jgi:CMP-N,N'-diacetyllegionaminic acid synthase